MTGLCVVCRKRQPELGQYACFGCVNRVLSHLGEIEEFVSVMSPMKSGGKGGIRAPGFRSTSPARDDVIVALDPRSGGGAAVYRLRDPRDESDTPIRSLVGSLAGIGEWVRGERGLPRVTPPTVLGECRFLRAHLGWCAGHDWFDDLADDIRELHGQARALSPFQRGKAVGACPNTVEGKTCRAALYAPPQGDSILCARCGREWRRTEWIKLADRIGEAS